MPRTLSLPASPRESRGRLEFCNNAFSFYLDRIGKIGFIDKVMGVYRLNPSSVWTGADQMSKLKQAIATRAGALAVARPVHQAVIRQRMLEKQQQLQALQAQNPQALIQQGR